MEDGGGLQRMKDKGGRMGMKVRGGRIKRMEDEERRMEGRG